MTEIFPQQQTYTGDKPQPQGVSTLVNLRCLELGANKIKVIENIDTLSKLEKLFLGKNKIAKLEVCNQWYCHKLRQICLRTRGELSRSAVFKKNNLIFKTLFKNAPMNAIKIWYL